MKRFVAPQVRERGRAYFDQARVTIRGRTSSRIEARVEGSRVYETSLEIEGNTLLADCSCPYFTDEGDACKHVWALILEVDDTGAPRGWIADVLEIAGAIPGFEPDDDYDYAPMEAPIPFPSRQPVPGPNYGRARVSAPPPRVGRAAIPEWRLRLGSPPPVPYRPGGIDDYLNPEGEFRYQLANGGGELSSSASIAVTFTRPKKAGGRTAPRTLSPYLMEHAARLPNAIDREIFALCAGHSSWQPGWFTLGAAAVPYVLPIICRSGRLRLQSSPDAPPLTLDEGAPWSFSVRARSDSTGLTIEGVFTRDGAERLLHDLPAAFASGLFVAQGALSRFDPPADEFWLRQLRFDSVRVPRKEADAFVAALLSWRHAPPIALPEELAWKVREMAPTPWLIVSAPGAAQRGWHPPRRVDFAFEYEGKVVRGEDLSASIEIGPREAIRRDAVAESSARRRMMQVGVREDQWSRTLDVEESRLTSMVERLLAEGWHVEVGGRTRRPLSHHSIAVTSEIDWFDVEGWADYDGVRASFPALLAAARSGATHLELGDGSTGAIPAELLALSRKLSSFGKADGDRIRFRRSQAALLDALLASRPEVAVDSAFARIRDRLRAFAGIEPGAAPKGFVGSLRAYQCEALGWFAFLREMGLGGCLADDMGLGKTVQVLALLESRRSARGRAKKPSLVVMPRSLVFNWLAEAARFTPKLKVVDHTGLGRSRGGGESFDGADVVLTTYGTLRRDAAQLGEVEWDYAILDESQAIKNATTQAAKAARVLRADHRLALSGTPIENHLGELWSLLEFLNPGMLGASSAFREYLSPANGSDPAARGQVARLARPFILRRTKEQVANELPRKTEQTIYCELEGPQRKLYDELRDHYRAALAGRIGAQGLAKSKIQVLEALLRLRQAACHPRLVNPTHAKAGSAKLDELMARLSELGEQRHKVLVFSQFTSLLAIVREELDTKGISYCYLDGATRDRASVVERFRTDVDTVIFLISLKAGGLGLNLVEAEYVILLDPWWNPAVEAQAIDRAHRIGQTRHVFAYRLVARDTVEEKILELQASKRELADAILGEDKSLIARLGPDDLEFLLS
ncbi:MAG: SNF2-related protein [Thermoanaerobaculia bacterium]